MGKISKVLYQEIDHSRCAINTAGEFYYYSNLIGASDTFNSEYVNYEFNQIKLKNAILGDLINSKNMGECRVKIGSSVLGISSLKNKVILIADIA